MQFLWCRILSEPQGEEKVDLAQLNKERAQFLLTQLIGVIPYVKELTGITDEARKIVEQQVAEFALSIKTSKLDKDQLEAFFKKPYYLEPVHGRPDSWYLIIPKFVDIQIGWMDRSTESYNRFLINRYMDWLGEIPEAIKRQLNWKAPPDLILDGEEIHGPKGALEYAWQKYRPFLHDRDENRIKINPKRAFDLITSMIKDGVLPFSIKPVDKADYAERKCDYQLREYQQHAWNEFLRFSAIGVFIPPGTGKTIIALWAMTHLKPPHLVVVPTRLLQEQWIERILAHTDLQPSEYEVLTYQSAISKASTKTWTTLLVDECLHYDQNIMLSDGTFTKIGPVVHSQKSVEVRSFNEKTGVWETKKVIGWIKKPFLGSMIRIRTTQRFSGITCTPNHKLAVYRPDGIQWIMAGNLKLGDYLLVHPKNNTRWRIPVCLGSKQKQLVAGTLLGDANLSPSGKMARIKLVHGVKQKAYLDHKRSMLSSLCFNNPKHSVTEFSKRGVFSCQSACSTELAELLSQSELSLIRTLDPLGLSYWFMDDGSLSAKSARINTQGRDLETVKSMVKLLKMQFGLDCKAIPTAKGPVIDFSIQQTKLLCSLISKYVIPSMQYKLLPEYRGKFENWMPDSKDFGITKVETISQSKLWGRRPSATRFVYCLDVEENHNFLAGNILVHNCQHLPANTFVKLSLIRRKYTIGLSGSPMREDGREEYIFALTGKPVGLSWEYFKKLNLIKSPTSHVWILKNFEAKLKRLDALLQTEMRTIIFSDSIDVGKAVAGRFKVPFVYGATKDNMATIQANRVVVVSRVGDEGMSLPDIERVIEVSWLGGSRRQELQRTTRLLHGEAEEQESYVLMTLEEYLHDRKRLFSIMDKGFKIVLHREGVSEKVIQDHSHDDYRPLPRPRNSRSASTTEPTATIPVSLPTSSGQSGTYTNLPGVQRMMALMTKKEKELFILLLDHDGEWFKREKLALLLGYANVGSMVTSSINLARMVNRNFIEQQRDDGSLSYRTNMKGKMGG